MGQNLIKKELSILFGNDDIKAKEWVAGIRKKIVMELKKRFKEFVALEKEAFHEASFFHHKQLGSEEIPIPDGIEMEEDYDLETFEEEIEDSEG